LDGGLRNTNAATPGDEGLGLLAGIRRNYYEEGKENGRGGTGGESPRVSVFLCGEGTTKAGGDDFYPESEEGKSVGIVGGIPYLGT